MTDAMRPTPILLAELLDIVLNHDLKQLETQGVIHMVKPQIQGSEKREELPVDDYIAIITGFRYVDRENANTGSEKWDESERRFFEMDKEDWPKEQEAKRIKAEAEGKTYHPKPYPSHRQFQYWWSFKVIKSVPDDSGEEKDVFTYRGRYLPRKKTTVLISNYEKNGLFKLLNVVPGTEGEFTSLGERIDANDAPDFDEEVVNKAVKISISHNAKGYAKIDAITRTSYKPTTEDIAELVLGAKAETKAEPAKADDFEGDIPF